MNIPKELRAPLALQFLAFMIVLGVFSFGFIRSANELKASVYESCVSRAGIENNSNRLLDQLIDSASKSSVFSPAEKAERIDGWRAVRHNAEMCVRL